MTREQVQAALGYACDLVNRTGAPAPLDEAVEAAFDEEFDLTDPDMLYLQEK